MIFLDSKFRVLIVDKESMVKYKNWKEAHKVCGLPGSYQVGSYGPKGKGIVRSYSNGTPGKDFIKDLAGGKYEVLYRLKDDVYKQKFSVNMKEKWPVRFFRKVSDGVEDLGPLKVVGFTDSGHVKMVSDDGAAEKENDE